MNKKQIPQHVKEALDRYINDRIEPGGFLLSVLSNNLFSVVFLADNENYDSLREIVDYIWNELPLRSWGSSNNVNEWLKNEN
jgi:hypothetical protein